MSSRRSGSGVSNLERAGPVAAVPIFGGYDERVVMPRVERICDSAGIDSSRRGDAVAFLTARYAIDEARVRPGETAVVTAAAGGVGTALLQLLALRGASTIALVGSGRSFALCASGRLGGRALFDGGGSPRSGKSRVDGRSTRSGRDVSRLWRRLARGGRYVLYGFGPRPAGGASRACAPYGSSSRWAFSRRTSSSVLPQLIGFNLSLLPNRLVELRAAADEIFRDGWRGAYARLWGRGSSSSGYPTRTARSRAERPRGSSS